MPEPPSVAAVQDTTKVPAFGFGAPAGVPGSPGAVVSIVSRKAADAPLEFPATSMATTCTRWPPSESADEVMLQVPLPLAVELPRRVAPWSSVTPAPGSVVPVKVGLVTLVIPSELLDPLSLAARSSGAAGSAMTVSIVTDVFPDDALVFPAVSVALTAKA